MIQLILILFRLYRILIIVRVLISWIHADPYHPVIIWIRRLTDPVLEPIRRLIPFERIGIDLSPLVALLAMEVLERLIVRSLYSF